VILEVPEVVILADGATAAVKAVAASVVDGRLERVVYTVEKDNGDWADVAAAAAAAAAAATDGRPSDLAEAHEAAAAAERSSEVLR